jgi:CheY-like chemotaxis protein
MRWMLVEDEPDLYEVLLTLYEASGIDVLAFTSGEEASEWVDSIDNHQLEAGELKLAVLDLRLPGEMSGVDVAARLRASPLLKDIGIVFITAFRLSPVEEKQVLEDGGADLLVYKPLPGMDEFMKKVKDLLG